MCVAVEWSVEGRGADDVASLRDAGTQRRERQQREKTTKNMMLDFVLVSLVSLVSLPALSLPPPKKKSEPPDWEAPKRFRSCDHIYLLCVDLCSVSEVVPITITCLKCCIESEITTTIICYDNCNLGNTSTM